MEEKKVGLSRDLIIHPGETLQDILEDRGISQKELALKTGVTDKHVSKVINGLSPISVVFAKKLEYALGIEASFWTNLQVNYDQELLEYEEFNNISEDEKNVLSHLKDIILYFIDEKRIDQNCDRCTQVLELRRLLEVSNLLSIPKLSVCGAFRASATTQIDPFVLYSWIKVCDISTDNIEVINVLNKSKLKESIPEIKQLMFASPDKMQKELESIFSQCGVVFKIVHNFRGAPVQGFIKTKRDKVILCMTIRHAFADIFWFTLFHEIAHILYDEIKQQFIDYEDIGQKNEKEERADAFARDTLIEPRKYGCFIGQNNFAMPAIEKFSKEVEVPTFITIGRLQKDSIIPWRSNATRYKPRFVWNE